MEISNNKISIFKMLVDFKEDLVADSEDLKVKEGVEAASEIMILHLNELKKYLDNFSMMQK